MKYPWSLPSSVLPMPVVPSADLAPPASSNRRSEGNAHLATVAQTEVQARAVTLRPGNVGAGQGSKVVAATLVALVTSGPAGSLRKHASNVSATVILQTASQKKVGTRLG